ncbi:hypothetical protein PMAYCL1PPCAC_13766, partial [Pristionchus mayeri]
LRMKLAECTDGSDGPSTSAPIEHPKFTIRAVLSEAESSEEVPLERVYVLTVTDRRFFATVLPLLPPLPERMHHLKRINGERVVVCLYDSDESMPDLMEYGRISECLVPKEKPLTRRQFDWAKARWPCAFHPNKDLESLLTASTDDSLHSAVFSCLDVLRAPRAACAVTRRGKRVAEGAQSGRLLEHASMRAVRKLAGAHRSAMARAKAAMAAVTRKRSAPGAAAPLVVVASSDPAAAAATEDVNTIVVPPLSSLDYLATGADVFLTHEPCAMCAMALVHARAQRVFFARRTSNGVLARREQGNLGEDYGCLSDERGWQLHLEPALNHHYRVFEVTFEDETEGKELNGDTNGQEEDEGARCGAIVGGEQVSEREESVDVDAMDRGEGGQWEDEGEEE